MRKKINLVLLAAVIFASNLFFVNCSQSFHAQSGSSAMELNFTAGVRVVKILSAPAVLTNNENANFKFEILESEVPRLKQVEFQIDNQNWQNVIGNSFSLDSLLKGSHQILIRAIAKDGSYSPLAEYYWTIDNEKPEVLVNQAPPAEQSSNSAQISFTSSDSASVVIKTVCTVDQVQIIDPCLSPLSLQNLALGDHEVAIYAIDKAENSSEPLLTHFKIVAASQMKTLRFVSKPDALTAAKSARFDFVSEGPGAEIVKFQCQTDKTANIFSDCTSPVIVDYSADLDGEHFFKVKGVAANGAETAVLGYNWKVDSTEPTITLGLTYIPFSTTDGNFVPSNLNLIAMNLFDSMSFSASDLGSGVDRIQCQILRYDYNPKNCTSAGTVQEQDRCRMFPWSFDKATIVKDYYLCQNAVPLASLSGGYYRVKIKAIDKAGNQNIQASEFKISEQSPAFVAVHLLGGAALPGNIVVTDMGGSFLPTYNTLGMGRIPQVVMAMGAPWYAGSKLLEGLRLSLTESDLQKIRVFAIANKSMDNTLNNKLFANGLVQKFGVEGYSFPFITTTNSTLAFGGSVPSARLDVTAVDGFSTIVPEVPRNFFDPFMIYPDIQAVWGLGLNQYSDMNYVVLSHTMATLNRAVGSSAMVWGGQDYRNATRFLGDSIDLTTGQRLSKMMKTALLMQKKLFLSVTTDGSMRGPASDIPGGPWTADAGGLGGVQMFFVVDPTNEYNYGRHMIGGFVGQDGQQYVNDLSVAANSPEKAAAIIACNYAFFFGRDCSAAVSGILTPQEIESTRVITKKQ